jgi:hypothetical protein
MVAAPSVVVKQDAAKQRESRKVSGRMVAIVADPEPENAGTSARNYKW